MSIPVSQINPVEYVWSHTKRGPLANFCADDFMHMGQRLEQSLLETRTRASLLRSFFDHAGKLLEETRDPDLAEFTGPLSDACERLQQTSAWIYGQMASDPLEAGAASTDYLRMFALTAMAFVWTRQAAVAHRKLEAGEGSAKFYRAKLDTARFFMTRMLPETLGLDAKIRAGAGPLMAPDDDAI